MRLYRIFLFSCILLFSVCFIQEKIFFQKEAKAEMFVSTARKQASELTDANEIDGKNLNYTLGSGSNSFLEKLFGGSATGVLLGYPYEGIGIPDLIVASLLLLVVLKIIVRISLEPPSDLVNDKKKQDPLDKKDSFEDLSEEEKAKKRAESAWNMLRDTPQKHPSSPQTESKVTEDFNTEDFLEGAKLLYSRMQVSWGARDIDDIAPFVTPEMEKVLREQAELHPEVDEIAVILVKAELISVEREENIALEEDDEDLEGHEKVENIERASVLFDALIQEGSADSSRPVDYREIWYFTHDHVAKSSWKLDAIEQVHQIEEDSPDDAKASSDDAKNF